MDKNSEIEISNVSKFRTEIMGVAAILIMLCHNNIVFLADKIQILQTIFITRFMQVGVDIFLFLSAFGCCHSFENDSSIICFYKKRFSRIIPSYFVVVLSYCIVRLLIGHSISLEEILYRFSIVTFFSRDVLEEWYVGAILVLYILFPIVYKMKKNALGITIILTMFSSLIFSVCNFELPIGNGIFIVRIPIFLYGILVYKTTKEGRHIYVREILMSFIFTMILFAINVVYNNFNSWWICRALFFPLSIEIILILLWVFQTDTSILKKVRTFLRWLGMMSFEIYLIHEKVLEVIGTLYPLIFNSIIKSLIIQLVSMLISILLAYAVRQCTVYFQEKIIMR